MKFLLFTIAGLVFSFVDALVGYIWLHDQFTALSYWDFFGMSIFGKSIVGSALFINELRNDA